MPVETGVFVVVVVERYGVGSIHPQGWVPVETTNADFTAATSSAQVAFTPKGGCPLKRTVPFQLLAYLFNRVAFTPKGGCPLKLDEHA